MPLISIEVTPDIATKIRGMAEAGVFSIIKGSATLNFAEGELKSVKTEIYSYPHIEAKERLDAPTNTLIVNA